MYLASSIDYPKLVPNSLHTDDRGEHLKIFGSAPESIAVGDWPIHEVFYTHNRKNTVRGLFAQNPPMGKILHCIGGSARANAVCIDPTSPHFGKVFSTQLNKTQGKLVVPGTWACGYRAEVDDTIILYLANQDHSSDGIGVNPFDPALPCVWGDDFSPEDAIQLDRDKGLQSLEDYRRTLGA